MRSVARASGVVVAWLLAGCASAPAPPPTTGPGAPDVPRRGEARPARETAVAAFERRQRDAAEAAFAQGRYVDALWAWDIVLALAPQDGSAAARRGEVQSAAQAAAADRLGRARQAQQRGDADAATKLYLETLAIAPDNAAAADALREIERQRTRRGNVVGFRAAAVVRNAMPAAAVADRNEAEHATMLAAQGEIEAAIAALEPIVARRGADAALRNELAELYVKQADRLQPKDRAAAIAALERSLQLVPGHKAATARLRALRPAAGAER